MMLYFFTFLFSSESRLSPRGGREIRATYSPTITKYKIHPDEVKHKKVLFWKSFYTQDSRDNHAKAHGWWKGIPKWFDGTVLLKVVAV